MKMSSCVLAALGALSVAGTVPSAQTITPTVMVPDQTATSQPLSQGRDDTKADDKKVHRPKPLPKHQGGETGDEARQTSAIASTGVHDGISFPGVGASGSAPPDTNMAVGPNHILQTVNSRYAIYNKTGGLLVGPHS